jgi:hypothetical protein
MTIYLGYDFFRFGDLRPDATIDPGDADAFEETVMARMFRASSR